MGARQGLLCRGGLQSGIKVGIAFRRRVKSAVGGLFGCISLPGGDGGPPGRGTEGGKGRRPAGLIFPIRKHKETGGPREAFQRAAGPEALTPQPPGTAEGEQNVSVWEWDWGGRDPSGKGFFA